MFNNTDVQNQAAPATDVEDQVTPVLHLPTFTATDAAPWFQRVEALFRLRGIRSSSKKADFVIGALPADVFSRISRWLASKGTDAIVYEDLKPAVILQCEPPPEEKSQRLLNLLRTPLGDQRPSDALREIWSLTTVLQSDGTSTELDLKRVLWMARLPAEIRTHITNFASRPEDELMQLADSVRGTTRFAQPLTTAACFMDVSNNDQDEIALATQQRRPPPRYSNQRPPPDASHGTLCFFHRRFGRDARNCRPPCSLSKNL